LKIALFIAFCAYLTAGLISAFSVKLPVFLISRKAAISTYILIALTWPVFYIIGQVDQARARRRLRQARLEGKI
jgi:hypothetical protein